MAKDGKEKCDDQDTMVKSPVISFMMLYCDQRKTKAAKRQLEELEVDCKIGEQNIE
jgi:hypothetical protein